MQTWSVDELLAQRAWLRSLAGRLVRDEAGRDDLVQEAWFAALTAPRAGDLRRWLGGVVRNRWRFERRTAERRAARELAATRAASAPPAAELAEQAELQRVLVGAVLALAEPYRSTVLLRYFGELSSRAIARQDGVPEGTVRSRLKRALDELRAELDRRHGGERQRWALLLAPLAKGAEASSAAWASAACIGLVVAGAASWWTIAARAGARELEQASGLEPIAAAPGNEPGAPDPAFPATELARATTPGADSQREALAASPTASTGGSLTAVRVVDPDGAPISEASITWWPEEQEQLVHTDNDGRVVLPVRCGDGLQLRVAAPGFTPREEKFGGHEIEVELVRAAVLVGRVRDAQSGEPIVGATLNGGGIVQSSSDASGGFRLEGLPLGEDCWVECEVPGYSMLARGIRIRTANPAPLELWLERGFELRGSVLDAVTGEPIADASIDQAGNGGELTRTDGHGRFATRVRAVVGEGVAYVRVMATGYCGVQLQVRDRADETLVVPLVRSAAIEGVVRDQLGRAVSGARVWLATAGELPVRAIEQEFAPGSPWRALPAGSRLTNDDPRATSDEAGRFRLEGAVPWQSQVEVWAEVSGGTSAGKQKIERMPAPGESVFVELALTVPLLTHSRAELGTGEITGSLRFNGEPFQAKVFWENGAARGDAYSDRGGTFMLERVAPGTVVLRAEQLWAPWSPTAERRTVTVVAGDTLYVDFDITVKLSAIRGCVRLPSGDPAPGREVWACDSADSTVSVRAETDEQGRYELNVPAAAGAYDLSCSYGPDVVSHEAVPPGAQGIDFELAPYGRARWRARDGRTGRALEALWFYRRAGESWMKREPEGEIVQDTEGFVEVELSTGRWELACGAPEQGYPLRLGPVLHIDEGGDAVVDVELQRMGEVEFLLDPAENLPAFIRLEAQDAGAFAPLGELEIWLEREVQIDGTGRARVSGLVPGTHRLVCYGRKLRFEPPSLFVGVGQSAPTVVRWTESGR